MVTESIYIYIYLVSCEYISSNRFNFYAIQFNVQINFHLFFFRTLSILPLVCIFSAAKGQHYSDIK